MKKNMFFALIVLVLATMACSVPTFGGNGDVPTALDPGYSEPAVQDTPMVAEIPADVPTVIAPVAEAVAAGPSKSICDAELIGTSLTDKSATEIRVTMPDGYKNLLVSMDSGLIKYAGEETDTVKGALLLADTSFSIITVTGNSKGLGWNTENERFNAHICALPIDQSPVNFLRDWQFGQEGSGSAGEHKPVGILIQDGALNFVWNSASFSPSDFNAAFAQ